MANRRFLILLFLASGLLLGSARCAWSEDNVSLKLHNDTSKAIDVYVASEKNSADKPWTHLQIDGDGDGNCALKSPDRYTVIVQAGDHRWKSKPIGLREFLSAQSGSVLRISETGLNSIVAIVEPGADAQMPAPDANDSAPPSPPATLPLMFRQFELTDERVWSLGPHQHTLKLHNDLSEAVDVYIAPQNSQEANPWTHLKISPSADATAELKASDPFIVRIEVSGGAGRSRPVYLQEFLDEHPDYVMALGRTYKGSVTGTPYGAGSAEGVTSGPPPRGGSGKPTAPLPPVSVGPDSQAAAGSDAGLPPTLMLEWETRGR